MIGTASEGPYHMNVTGSPAERIKLVGPGLSSLQMLDWLACAKF